MCWAKLAKLLFLLQEMCLVFSHNMKCAFPLMTTKLSFESAKASASKNIASYHHKPGKRIFVWKMLIQRKIYRYL